MLICAPHPCTKSPAIKRFSGLMELYETNYMRMMCLCPDLHYIKHNVVSHIDGALDVHLQLLERCKYTTTVLLTYYFQDNASKFKPEPNLVIRIYHDARQAEVMSRSYRRIRMASSSLESRELNTKWVLNRFLYKWLGYCRFIGHSFGGEVVGAKQLDGRHECMPLRC